MGLNKSKGNMYSWVTHTWNTVKGECPHGCQYCYMKRWGKQTPIRFDGSELNTDLGSKNVIFVGSSCDMWAEGVPDEWISKTLDRCMDFDNTYLFQSKNPRRFSDHFNRLSTNTRFCTTIETNRWYPDVMGDTPKPQERAEFIREWPFDVYVTIEPVMNFDLEEMVALIKSCQPKQVSIGADSGNNLLPEPS